MNDARELGHAIRGTIRWDRLALSPELDPAATGIAIAAHQIVYDDEEQALDLLLTVTVRLPEPIVEAYQVIQHALVAVIEDAGAGRATALRLIDPAQNLDPPPGHNYVGPLDDDGSGMLCTAWCSVSLRLAVPYAEGDDHPGVFLRVVLAEHLSSTIAIDPKDGRARSYREGEEVATDAADPEDE